MRAILVALFLGLIAATPAVAQSPNVQQMLQGLFTGDQNQDRALQEAFERGYQRGRQDEARQQQSNDRYRQREERGDADRYGSDRNAYQGNRRPDPAYRRSGSSDYSC